MEKNLIKDVFSRLNDRQKKLNEEVVESVHSIIKNIPGGTVSFVGSPAYADVEGYDNWLETSIYGARLTEHGNLEFTLASTVNDDGEESPDWTKDYVIDNCSKNADINWFSVLESLTHI